MHGQARPGRSAPAPRPVKVIRSGIANGMRLVLCAIAASSALFCTVTLKGSEVPVWLSGETMGTTYTVRLAGPPSGMSVQDLQHEIEIRLERVNDLMSTWRPDSELSRFNRHEGDDWFPVSPETAQVVSAARRISQSSGGAFDATVLPLVDLWSFGPAGRPQVVPSAVELEEARKRIGYARVDVRDDPPALRKLQPDMRLDLSAIAKGYGVDVVAEYLDEIGRSREAGGGAYGYLVEIGGEVRAAGTKSDGLSWQVGIETPTADRRGIQRAIPLRDRALATSGDYRHFFVESGQRFSHTIDPRTGRPIEHRLASVSILAETCMEADGLATALMVLGEEDGYNWAVQHDLAALFLVHAGDRFVERPTPAFSSLFPAMAQPREPESAMQTFLLALAIFIGAVLLMAVGAFFGRRIRGSCGGLAGLRDERGNTLCEACTTPSDACGGVTEGRRRDTSPAVEGDAGEHDPHAEIQHESRT